jgi:hypothetical protein
MKIITKLLLLFVLFSLFVQSIMACGPFTVEPIFSFSRHADYPLNEFAKGKIGIVPTSYGRMSLFIFYRQLNNLPLSANEQTQYLKALNERIGTYIPDSAEEQPEPPAPQNNAIEQWKTSRAKVFAGDPKLETEKRLPDDYFTYTSCLDDAFRNAAKTLEARIAKNNINDEVKEWVNGQDAVFANCGEGNKTPANVPENSPEWLTKDRAYQIAAALLYAGKNPEARTEFFKIANDSKSPWNKTAKFVVARTYIREASFIDDSQADYSTTPNPNASNIAKQANDNVANLAKEQVYPISKSIDQKKSEKAELYQKAETTLREILGDNSMKDFHPSARRLLNLVGFRAKPLEQRRQLAVSLVQKGENPNFYNDLVDYVWLLDKVENDSRDAGLQREQKEAEKAGKDYDYNYDLKRQDIPQSELGADLTDWLFTFQADDGFAHAYSKWKQSKSLAWLTVTIIKATKDSTNLAEILSEADKIKSDSPAFATLRHHQVRLLIENGKKDEARQKLDEILVNFKNYPRSTQNEFTSQRMKLAENLNDFLKYAQRQAATFVWSDDANERGDDLKDSKELAVWKDRTMFDYDSVDIFNERMPLSVLRQAALSPNLPNHLKKFLVIAVWTRSFVLGNIAVQTEFTPLMNKFAPEFKVPAGTSEANSLLAIGRNPSIQIYVPVGYGRDDSDPTSIDSIRGNWWCAEKDSTADYPSFMTASQKSEAVAEQKKVASAGESATFLARSAVEFANKNMSNPNTPEILHLAVRSTRYGCKDANTLRYSKAAFDILHKRFPRSEWTKKTPYFFGEPEN